LIKRIMMLSAIALSAGIGSASAAPASDFQGFYLGGQAGYGWNDADYCGPAACLTLEAEGFNGGLFGGYNWQWDGWVAGVEGNFGFVEGDESDSFGVVDTFDPNWEAAIRARVGAFWEGYMFYAAAGVTWLDYDWDKGLANQSQTETGWTYGFGIERQITNVLRARIEYRHGEYDNDNLSFPGSDREVEPDTDVVMVGLALDIE
jgi:outer membrane immunogenic protein